MEGVVEGQKPPDGSWARRDGCVTNGSNLDHFMCEICAAEIDDALAQ
jgi:hypothetical protein